MQLQDLNTKQHDICDLSHTVDHGFGMELDLEYPEIEEFTEIPPEFYFG